MCYKISISSSSWQNQSSNNFSNLFVVVVFLSNLGLSKNFNLKHEIKKKVTLTLT